MDTQTIIKHLGSMYIERIKLGLTRKDVATRTKVSERAIKKFEDSSQIPRRETYNKLAAVFGWEVWR